MRIAIIGGGFTGLAAGYELTKAGHQVTILERETVLGGLAHGWKEPHWDWYLEKAYHHLFTNDHAIIGLIKELGLGDKLIIKRPVTATYFKGKIYQLDSPLHLLTFDQLSLLDRLRTGILLAGLKLNPFWQPLENITAEQFFIAIGGLRAWQTIWEPLMVGKFGEYAPTIAASWLWARVYKRTPKLCYIAGGFQTLVNTLAAAITSAGGVIHTNTTVTSIDKNAQNYQVTWDKQKTSFEKILVTTPTPIALKLIPTLLTAQTQALLSIPHLHAQTLILETKTPILKDTYWLNINDRSFPFLAVVAHTNFMEPAHYGGRHLTYFGNYLPQNHPYLSMTKDQLLKKFLPFIKRLKPSFHFSDLYICHLFIGFYAQPVHQLHYSQKAPGLTTSLPGVYLANMDSIYPWDRGTNYAIELGQKAARKIVQ